MKKWVIHQPDSKFTADLQSKSDLSQLSCKVLVSQGCISIEQAGQRMGCTELSDPFLICDMKPAVRAINEAIDAGKRICVYGDYDCDGVTSTVILYTFLEQMGADVTWRIPERREGYGLNEQAVREMHEDGVQMIITVDNGISAIPEAKLMKELGIELVITDHHQAGEELPEALAVVDAHRKDNLSPYRFYCGAGIALLLVAAMNDGDIRFAMEQYGDLVAVATIADVVALTGENRYLVQEGLDYLKNTERQGLLALREISGMKDKPLNSMNVAFSIAPRINAAGRMASPKLAVELLLEEDPQRAKELAEKLDRINTQRKDCENEIIKAVDEKIQENSDLIHERVMVFDGEDWHGGVIGIVAARLLERFGKPCFMISVHDGMGHGSARSFGEFSVFECLQACDDLLEKYGGHPAAGGFTVKAENIPAFKKRIAEYSAEKFPDMPVPEISAACVLDAKCLNAEEVESLLQLEPFGAENPEPLFFVENARIQEIRPLSEGAHTKLMVSINGIPCEALLFRTSPESLGLRVGDVCHMMVKLSVNTWNGRKRVNLNVQDIRISGMNQSKLLAAMQAYDKYRRKEPLSKAYYQAITPNRPECITVYKAVTETQISVEKLAMQMNRIGMNYCKYRICLDVFAELGLMELTEGEQFVKRLPVPKKVDLHNSKILSQLEQYAKEEML